MPTRRTCSGPNGMTRGGVPSTAASCCCSAAREPSHSPHPPISTPYSSPNPPRTATPTCWASRIRGNDGGSIVTLSSQLRDADMRFPHGEFYKELFGNEIKNPHAGNLSVWIIGPDSEGSLRAGLLHLLGLE